LDTKPDSVDREVVGGLELHFQQAAAALALLLEQGRADHARVPDAGQVGVAPPRRGAGLDLVVAQHFHAVAAQAGASRTPAASRRSGLVALR
jgi:hypothetical protein